MWEKRGIKSSIEEVFLENMKVSSLEDVNEWFRKS